MSESTPWASPTGKFNVWCPFCRWHMVDQSVTARKRLGLHITKEHQDLVLFPIDGPDPEPLELIKE